ncbi:hypothetical protein ACFQ07_17330, partial [Actinomadura adrarensis]
AARKAARLRADISVNAMVRSQAGAGRRAERWRDVLQLLRRGSHARSNRVVNQGSFTRPHPGSRRPPGIIAVSGEDGERTTVWMSFPGAVTGG